MPAASRTPAMLSGTVGSEPVKANSPAVPRSPLLAATAVGTPFPAGVVAGVDGVAEGVGVGVGVGVDTGAAGRTVIVTVVVVLGLTPFEAVIVTGDDPDAVGVPEITPVVPSSVSPAGSPVAVKVGDGVPVAVTVYEYGCPTVAGVGAPEVIVGAGVWAGVPAAGQPDEAVIVFVSSVTAPVRASSRPTTVAPVVAVTDCCARTVPWNRAPVPIVAELPTCQKTLHELAPPVIEMRVPEPIVSVDAAWNTHTESALPASVSAPVSASESAPPEYTPGVSDRPFNWLRPERVGVRDAATSYAVVVSRWAWAAAASVRCTTPFTTPGDGAPNPVIEVPGETPTSPFTTDGPVFVTALAPRTP